LFSQLHVEVTEQLLQLLRTKGGKEGAREGTGMEKRGKEAQ
jgi:hypothetical protein